MIPEINTRSVYDTVASIEHYAKRIDVHAGLLLREFGRHDDDLQLRSDETPDAPIELTRLEFDTAMLLVEQINVGLMELREALQVILASDPDVWPVTPALAMDA